MLVNLVPEFLATLAAPSPSAAYHEYLDRHRPLLSAYWQNYVLDPASPHAEPIIETALRADRSDLRRLLEDVDVVASAEDALRRSLELLEADCPVDLYLMVGVGAANAGELVVAGRGIAFVCLEHFTGRANAQTYGMGLAPELLPLWIAHEVAHALRYTSPTSRAAMRRLIGDLGGGGYYDAWEIGSRATLRELVVNEGVAIAASQAVAPGSEPWEYFGYNRRQYRRLRELDAFLRRASTNDLASTGLGLRLRYLSGTPTTPVQGERRRNRPLREVLDELLSHTRDIARRAKTMTPAEVDYAQQRLEWLADEVWRVATGEATPPE